MHLIVIRTQNIYIKDKTYISCKHDYSDLSEKIEYAVENFDEIQKQYVETLKQEYLTKYRPGYLADYTVKLFKDGRWHYMHIDDRIPVDLSGRPIYLRGVNPNETWSMLLEKAYAKLHGCYESLASGFIDEALRDLTAGATLYLDLNQKQT